MANNGQTADLLKASVTADDLPRYEGGGVVNFMIPWFMLSVANMALPAQLPPYWSLRFGVAAYWSRDIVLRSTILHEAFWAGAVGKASTKASAKSFDLKGPRSARYQQMLVDWGGDGYVPSQQRGVMDYLTTNNGEHWEIVRVSNAAGSRIVGLVHLDSLRTIRTGDPVTPILFQDLKGRYHELKYYQVMSIVDQPDPAAASLGIGHCAAEKCYEQIYKLAVIENYIKEKVSGTGATELDFVKGVNDQQITNVLKTAKNEAVSKGQVNFQGHVIVGILAQTEMQHIAIKLRDLPDGFDRVKELEIAQLAYALSIGLDPQDLNPALVGRGALGIGAQAVILDEKQRVGGAIAARDKHMTHLLNQYILPDSVTFAFSERDMREEKQNADISAVRETTRASMVASGEITKEQALQMAVDAGDAPEAFLTVPDMTDDTALTDEDQPTDNMAGETEAQQEAIEEAAESEPESVTVPVVTKEAGIDYAAIKADLLKIKEALR